MYFISIGTNCCVAYNIKKYINESIPTQFFDWSRTNFKCVLYILNLRTIDTIFNIKNFIIDKEIYKDDNNISITLKNFVKDDLCLLYHHDIEYTDNSDLELTEKLTQFINKYKRRHERLINLIKTSQKLCFIHHIRPTTDDSNIFFDYNDCKLFNEILRSINKDINYILVLLDNNYKEDYKYIHTEFFLKINLKYFTNEDIEFEWTFQKIDWNGVFKLIQKLCYQE
jgi:hypothetical protein